MKKCILVVVLAILALPTQSLAKKKEDDNILNPISPKKVEEILETASKEAKKNAPEIKKYYDEYMKSLGKFAKEMTEVFKDFF